MESDNIGEKYGSILQLLGCASLVSGTLVSSVLGSILLLGSQGCQLLAHRHQRSADHGLPQDIPLRLDGCDRLFQLCDLCLSLQFYSPVMFPLYTGISLDALG